MIAEGRGQHAGADLGALRPGAERAEPDERRRRVPVGMLPRLEMVADEDRVEPDLFGEAREIEQLLRGELLGRGLVSKFQHLSLLLRVHHGDTEDTEDFDCFESDIMLTFKWLHDA